MVPSASGDGDTKNKRRNSVPLKLKEGAYFGERALLTNEPRGADVICSSDECVCLTLDREAFDTLLGPMRDIIKCNLARQCLQNVPFISQYLNHTQLSKVAQAAKEEEHVQNSYILQTNGGANRAFYVVREGDIGVVDAEGNVERLLQTGAYFGEGALMSRTPKPPPKSYYVSSETASVFKVTRTGFEKATGISLKMGLTAAGAAMYAESSALTVAGGATDAAAHKSSQRVMNPDNLTMDELEKIKILGEGTFGRVYLVRAARAKYAEHYALKVQQKAQIDDLKQKKNIMNEKKIMEILDHPFILRLEATFQTRNCLNMLLEIVTGGELFDLLADRAPNGVLGYGDAAFYTACVVAAFNHFWEKDIIYRDLKPENLMLDKHGYIKVVDYGFAKVLNGKMTHTCCGTLEYFAPELVR
jgi:cGMP-dependent protein kinase 1